jgi:hypothetical protein
MVRIAMLVCCLAFGFPGLAEACRRSPQPAEMMKRQYAAVVVVRIDEVRPLGSERLADAWRAVGTRVSLVQGSEPPTEIIIGHTEMPNCQEGRPVPRVGEYWVAYLEGVGEPDTVVYNAWPLDRARSLDPRFSGLPPGER